MSGIFGGGGQATTDQRLNAIQLTQSAYGNCVALVYGQTRIAPNLIWYGDFVATPHTESGGGKGGGGGGHTSFTYSASLALALCEGPIDGIGTVYKDKEQTTLAAIGNATTFLGSGTQAAWSYLSTNHAGEAIPYNHTAYVGFSTLDLGGAASLPNFTFEIQGLKRYGISGVIDALPADIVTDYCTDAEHGANFPYLATFSTANDSWIAYCKANGIFISPAETTQRDAVEFLKDILQISNGEAVPRNGVVDIVTYGDTPVTGFSTAFVPNLTPQFSFNDEDYIYAEGQDPVELTRTPPSETFNVIRIEYLDRSNNYNTAIAEAKDDRDIAIRGERIKSTISFHAITTKEVAKVVAHIILQRQLYILNTFTFKVRADYCGLEPMDLVQITDSNLALSNELVRIKEIQDDENDELQIVAEEVGKGASHAPIYAWQAAQGYAVNYATAPGSVSAPLIFEAPQLLVGPNGGYEIWIAVCGTSGFWGGADIWMSMDNTTYQFVGSTQGSARYGTLRSTLATGVDPDTTHTLQVQLVDTGQQLVAGTTADADNLRTLLYVDGEVMAYRDSTLVGAGQNDLGYLRRGKYGTAIAAHTSGTAWARIDDAIVRIPYDVGMIGQTIYFKFTSFNIWGKALESLASVTAYSLGLANRSGGKLLPNRVSLIPRGNCAVSGSSAFKAGGSAAWDSDVRSLEAYAGGCSLTWQVNQIDRQVMVGLNTDPLTDQSYTSIDFAFYTDTSGSLSIYESGSGFSVGSYTADSVLEIRYDGQAVQYYVDGVLLRQVAKTGGVFFLDSSFFTPGAGVRNVRFVPLTTASTVPFIARGSCVASSNSAKKLASGSFAYDSDVYSTAAYESGCSITWQADQTTARTLIGLNSDPLTDQNYTSLDYAWFMDDNGDALIYESGTAQNGGSPYGTYTTATVFSIKYDGQQVRYFLDGVLKRTVGAINLILFADSSFYFPGGSVRNLEFGPLTTAPSIPFIARGSCVATATTIRKVGGSAGWNSDCYSFDAYVSGCALSFQSDSSALDLIVGLNSDPTTDQNYTSIDYCWNLDSTGVCAIFENGSSPSSHGSYTSATQFSITYDGRFVRYLKDGTVVRTVPAADKTLFFDTSFFSVGASVRNVTFGPLNSSTPAPFIARGNCVVSDDNIMKVGGSSAWDSDCYSINGYQTCHVQFKANNATDQFMAGLNADPLTDTSYPSIDYAWYASAGTAQIYEGGSAIASIGAYTAASVFLITYDGSNIRYYLDGVLQRTVAVAGATFFMDSSFYTPGGGANSVRFGPTVSPGVVDTPQIGNNAATEFGSTSSASGSFTSNTYSGPPTTDDRTIVTLSYTNNTGVTQTLEFFATCRFTVSGAGGGWLAAPRFTGTYAQSQVVGRTAAADEQYSYSSSATLAAGSTATITLSCEFKTGGTGSNALVMSYTDATLKYNVLKK